MLPDLSPMELGRLRMSVGYGTHKKGRPLSPIQVGKHLSDARGKGVSPADCAKALQLRGTGQIGRFLRILDLPEDLHHMIGWGSGRSVIGFSAAVEMARLKQSGDRRYVAKAVLSDSLTSKEVRQIVQLHYRSEREIHACVDEVLNMRPDIEKRFVFIGSVERDSIALLEGLTQDVRDGLLNTACIAMGLRDASCRLGKQFFTLVGGEPFNASMGKLGKKTIEQRVRFHVKQALKKPNATR